jgi:hypothetical protein
MREMCQWENASLPLARLCYFFYKITEKNNLKTSQSVAHLQSVIKSDMLPFVFLNFNLITLIIKIYNYLNNYFKKIRIDWITVVFQISKI